jgi:hypothetical protein
MRMDNTKNFNIFFFLGGGGGVNFLESTQLLGKKRKMGTWLYSNETGGHWMFRLCALCRNVWFLHQTLRRINVIFHANV